MSEALVVDGHEFENEESSLLGDGQFPPFYVFDPNKQQNVAGPFDTRAEAEVFARSPDMDAALRKALEALRECSARFDEDDVKDAPELVASVDAAIEQAEKVLAL